MKIDAFLIRLAVVILGALLGVNIKTNKTNDEIAELLRKGGQPTQQAGMGLPLPSLQKSK